MSFQSLANPVFSPALPSFGYSPCFSVFPDVASSWASFFLPVSIHSRRAWYVEIDIYHYWHTPSMAPHHKPLAWLQGEIKTPPFRSRIRMKTEKRKKLERTGWKVGSADEFLNLSAAESTLVGMRLALARKLKGRRLKLGLSQTELAQRLHSSQSRVAKMEAAAPEVTVDLLVRGMLAVGAKAREVGAALASA